MGKLIVFMNLTLDGVMQAPGRPDEDTGGGFQYGGWGRSYDAMPSSAEVMSNCGAMLFGRKTYEDFYNVWHQPNTPFTQFFDNIPKFVASTTLDEPLVWENSSLLKGDVASEVRDLKNRVEKDIIIMGSGKLIRSLMQHDVIDEYALLIYPIALGEGGRLFSQVPHTNLNLLRTKATNQGVILAIYEPARVKTAHGS